MVRRLNASEDMSAADAAVTNAITRPVQTIAGFFSGARHATSSVRAGAGWQEAVKTGREEAARRERDLAEELGPEDHSPS